MGISMIWAMDSHRLIGKDNGLPWHLPNDMAFFRAHTRGKTIVMGRKTFDSIGGKPLPKRPNIVMTRNLDWSHEGVEIVHGVQDVVDKAAGDEEIMVIGGAEIYRLMMPYADKLYVTRIEHEFEGDDYFPDYDESEWELVEDIPGVVDELNRYAHRFTIYQRKC
ncbi:dihydrofolate reductase [Paenibacillus sp. ACRRX]|uniref:dihydrofolate reductase n=1 Tax=Paenibacillus sp. ACRRX TaxID=2918206 RepID=UPI001EF53BB7|nr:dihydrofolate reductase [Paenibacillus sp. ACRRX]MCG7407136.1 dihydrofolate reductase [Paenibacillus sp. ACRRX]